MGSPPECVPLKYGFTRSYGYFHGQIDPYTHRYKTGVRSWHRNDVYLDEPGHATDLITDEAVRVIEAPHEKPFFLYVAYSVPHFPLNEPDRWTAPYRERIAEESRRWFAASVTHMDHGIGRIVDALDRAGLRKRTLVVFVSDNGGQKSWHSTTQYEGRYGDKPHRVLGDNRPLRGWKGDVYEGGIRVPALAVWPGVLTPGVAKAPVHIVDWKPTLLCVAGCAAADAPGEDGRNVWPVITGTLRAPAPRTFYWKTPNASAVRQGDWKLVAAKGGTSFELYNLADDPYEKNDLASREPGRLAELKARLEAIGKNDRERRKG
jgi:arylsulfatase A-like enzyme